MENLPIPKLRSSWVSAIILTIFSFFVYYLALFPGLLRIYDQQFYKTFYPHTNTFRPNGDDLSINEIENLDIMVRAPHYIYPAGPVFVFISATNRSDITIRDIGVYLTSNNPPPFIIPSLYNDEVFDTGIKFDEIPPHSTVTGRIALAAQSNIKLFNASIVADSAQVGRYPSGETPTLVKWTWKALQHSFIENLLLPPWSNGLIFALALFSSYLVHKKRCKYDVISQDCDLNDRDEQETFTAEWLRCIWTNLKWSFLILLITTFLITIFIVDWLFFVIIPLFLAYMIFLAWRSRDLCVSDLYPAIGVLILLSSLYRIFFDYPNIGFVWSLFPFKLMHGKPFMYDIILALMALLSFILILLSIILAVFRLMKNDFPTTEKQEISLDDPLQPAAPKKDNGQASGGKKISNKKKDQEKISGLDFKEKKEAVQAGYFRRHDQNMAEKISKKIEKARGEKEEVDILTFWDGQLRDRKYGEDSEIWRQINNWRAVSPEIQKLIEYIKIRNPEAVMEKREKEREAERQQKILKKNKKLIKVSVVEQEQNAASLSVEVYADDAGSSKNEGVQSSLLIVEENKVNDQFNQEDMTSSDATQQNE